MKKLIGILFLITYVNAANAAMLNDVRIPGYTQENLLSLAPSESKSHYTVQEFNYYQVSDQSQKDIINLLNKFNAGNQLNLNDKVKIAIMEFTDKPYGMSYAQGEGDWKDPTYRGQIHIQQAPVYRTDQFVCNTLVQTVLAAIQSHTINQFNQYIVDDEYGAAGNDDIHYYNRNNFISGDFNPVNQASGAIFDKTLSFPHHTTSAIIDRQNWFKFQQKDNVIARNVSIIDTGNPIANHENGEQMYQRFHDDYPSQFHQFLPENVAINYIPKEKIVVYHNGSQQDEDNEKLIQTLPTPSIIEIVRDARKWNIAGRNIKDIIGTELNVSHLGLIYRRSFDNGQVIYNRINCKYNEKKEKICEVTPVLCTKKSGCSEVMYAAATSAYPNGYFYYKNTSGHYQCTANKPKSGVPYTMCNRVQSMPLGDYFSSYQYGKYPYMSSLSILGINIEKIVK